MTDTNHTTWPAYVYVIAAGTHGPFKIGMTTKSPEQRVVDLQTGASAKLIIFGVANCTSAVEARMMESTLHKECEKHRMAGEWFGGKCLRVLLKDCRFAWRSEGDASAIRLPDIETPMFDDHDNCPTMVSALRSAYKKVGRKNVLRKCTTEILDVTSSLNPCAEDIEALERILKRCTFLQKQPKTTKVDDTIHLLWLCSKKGYFMVSVKSGEVLLTVSMFKTKRKMVKVPESEIPSYIFVAHKKSRFAA